MLKRTVLAVSMLCFLVGVFAQQKQILIADYENKPNTGGWWKDNAQVKFAYDEIPASQLNTDSKVCLHVRWDSVPQQPSFCLVYRFEGRHFCCSRNGRAMDIV
jgi:hypothetical protein